MSLVDSAVEQAQGDSLAEGGHVGRREAKLETEREEVGECANKHLGKS
jgi:hypothetical protein